MVASTCGPVGALRFGVGIVGAVVATVRPGAGAMSGRTANRVSQTGQRTGSSSTARISVGKW